jgi:hypothetical protein
MARTRSRNQEIEPVHPTRSAITVAGIEVSLQQRPNSRLYLDDRRQRACPLILRRTINDKTNWYPGILSLPTASAGRNGHRCRRTVLAGGTIGATDATGVPQRTCDVAVTSRTERFGVLRCYGSINCAGAESHII